MTLAPFVRTGEGVHPTIDMKELRAEFPDHPNNHASHIGSAIDLPAWEMMREKYEITSPDAVPCDLFVWGTGEPPDPRLTRVGGVPWLPKSEPWPVIGRKVSTFLCQFNFRDSKDLDGQLAAKSLPGDLLLVFAASEYDAMVANSKKMRFIWVSAEETDTYTLDDVPEATEPFEFVSTWGARYRSEDYPSLWDKACELEDENYWWLPVLWGTKIGGVPYHSQGFLDKVPKNYLCQLVSIQARTTRWPWVDVEAPLPSGFGDDGVFGDHHTLMIGDMGEITFFMKRNGKVTASSACG